MAEIAGFLYGAWNLECLEVGGAPGSWPGPPWLLLYCPCGKITGWDPVDLVTSELGLSEAQGCLWGHALYAGETREGC